MEAHDTHDHQGPFSTDDAPRAKITRGSLRRFTGLLGKTKPPLLRLGIAIGFSVVTTLVGLVVPLFMKGLVDGFSVQSLDIHRIILMGAAFLCQAAGTAVSVYLLNYSGQRVVAGLRELLWKKQLALPVSYYDEHPSGDLISRMNNDTAVVKTLIAENVSGFLTGIISVIGAVAILLYLDWRMTLVMLGALPLAAVVMVPLGRFMHRISKATMDENARFTSVLSRALSEIRLVKASNAEGREHARGNAAIKGLFGFGIKEGRVMAMITPLMSFVMMALLVVIIGYGGVRISSGAMSAGGLVAFILYLIQILMPITQITTFVTQLQKAQGATESIVGILDAPEEKLDGARRPLEERGAISVENLHFSYGKGEPVIRGISFTAEPGCVTAVVGPSGGGKTTLFSLLERFYEPDEGAILYGNTPIQEYALKDWRSRIGYVAQDSPLLAGTIRENIVYGVEREVSDNELRDVARMAYADDFISQLPQGYDTDVGERGVKLSGGQRQRVAIARALLRDPAILMLDEATSSLDSASEMYVQKALENLMRGRTTLVIAHRLSTVVDADRILFVDKGLITGSGTHEELLATHDMYRQFAVRQLRISEPIDEMAAAG